MNVPQEQNLQPLIIMKIVLVVEDFVILVHTVMLKHYLVNHVRLARLQMNLVLFHVNFVVQDFIMIKQIKYHVIMHVKQVLILSRVPQLAVIVLQVDMVPMR